MAGELRKTREVAPERTPDAALFEALFAGHPDPMALLDGQGRVLRLNGAFAGLVGAEEAEAAIGQALPCALRLPEDEPSHRALSAALGKLDDAGDAGQQVTIRHPADSGESAPRWIAWQLGQGPDGAGSYALGREVSGPAHEHWMLERLAQVAERTANLVIVTDPERRIEWVNGAFTRRTGYTLEEARGQNPGALLHEEVADPAVLGDLKRRLDAGEPVRCELRSRARDGTEFWCDLDIQPLTDDAGRIVAFLSVQTEITERRKREMQTAADRNRLQATLEALPDLLIEVDAEGRYVDFHSGRVTAEPIPPENFLGRTLEEVLPPEVAAQRREIMKEVDAGKRPRGRQYRLKDGSQEVWRELSAARRAPDRPGDPHGYLFLIRDVTDRVLAQKELREREALLQGLFALSPLGIALSDLETGRFLDVNEALLAATGYSREEFLRLEYDDLIPPDLDKDHRAAMDALRETGRHAPAESEHLRKDGSRYPVRRLGLVATSSSGRPLVWSIVEDISERRSMEESLSQSARAEQDARARLLAAVGSLPDAFVYFDADDRLVLCNERYIQLYPEIGDLIAPGVTFEEIVRANLEKGVYRIAPGEEGAWLERSLDAHRGEGVSLEVPLANGRWLRMIEMPTGDGGRIGVRQDITELKHAEQRLADIIHGAQAGTWEWHLDSGKNIINARWAEMLGYTLEELGAQSIGVWEGLTHPDDMEHVQQRVAGVLTREQLQFEYELRMRHKQGHWVWVLSRGRVVSWSGDGRPQVMAGVHLDITAQKEAEQRLEDIISGAQVGLWQHDLCSGLNHVDERWAQMIGYDLENITPLDAKGFMQLVHPDDRPKFTESSGQQNRDGSGHISREFRMRHRDGGWIWVMSRGRVTSRDAQGDPLVFSGVHIDITDRKELEAALMAEHAYVARLIETSVSGVLARDAEGQIIFANAEAERLLGLIPPGRGEEHFGRVPYRVTTLDGVEVPEEKLPFALVQARGVPLRDARFALECEGQPRRYLSINAAPVRAEGLRAQVVQSVTDITAQVEAEAALRHAADKAEAANQAKSGFLANISHEIRTPLNGVLGMAELLDETLTDEKQRGMLDAIRESGQILLHTLNDVLDMSKIEAGKLELEEIGFRPADLLAKVEAVHGMLAREKGVQLLVISKPGAGQPRWGDPHRIMQVLNNLVGNALKFTERGEIRVRIGGDAGAPLHIEVQDTGIGMSAEQSARIFQAFEQADGSVSRRFGGSGLGMAIVQRLVGMMGGEISLQSAPGQGTRISITLPLPLATGIDETVDAAAPEAAAQARQGLQGVRVLAADDNATNRRILEAMLGRLGAEVTMVADGRAACEVWAPGRFDVLLLDISMPEMDGIAALGEIGARAAAAGAEPPPAIAITAHALAHQIAEFRAAGFMAHVAKPFRRDGLAEAVQTVLQGRAG
ncbi:PAS domain S-box protein [Alkalilacustris brevis]|uniref:PAS domain S-box protein n=1 Tax=Alkalilacustris brevis TaxID=2026338 RepID=UPI000E0DCA5D|nr:PAS domain S-box protein [Alkalilacustris brevis]